MSFLDDLREYLESVGRGEQRASPDIDEPMVRRHLVSTLEKLEREGTHTVEQLQQLHQHWTEGDRAVEFAHALAWRLRAGFAADCDSVAMQNLVHVALSRELGLSLEHAGSVAKTLELQRLADEVIAEQEDPDESEQERPYGPDPHGWREPEDYARTIRAVRRRAKVELTPIGKVFLDLTGRDAVRWLLHVESEVAIGDWSEGLLTRFDSQALMKAPEDIRPVVGPAPVWPCHLAVLQGLSQLSLIALEVCRRAADGVLYSGYSLLPLGRELLAEIADVRDTPFRLLARGLLSDETHRTLTGSQGPGLSVALAHSAAESVARYARVVVHEMVNTLAPVRVALETLGEGLKQGRPVAELLTQCTRIDRGIEQAFQFLEDSKTTASLTEVREPFDIGAALRSMEEGIEVAQATIERQIEAGLPKLLGHRDRFVVAMRDLLRNAVYAGHGSAAALQVRVTARLDGSHVLISVEDNGPGVPVAERHLIFAPGFSRRTGGSGQGLSLLKEVIETDHGGTVDCDTSSLGGARFTVRIPLIPGERP